MLDAVAALPVILIPQVPVAPVPTVFTSVPEAGNDNPARLDAVVAVVALPDSAAVIVPAVKFPDAFLRTIVLTVVVLAVIVAELD